MFTPKMPQSRIIQEYRDKIEETKKEQQLHSSSNGNDSVNNTKTVEDDIIVDEDNNHNDNNNNNPLKQITNITNSNTSSNVGSNNSNNISISSNSNSSKSSPQVLQQAELSEQLEDSSAEIEREFEELTEEERKEYKEIMAETYLETMLNSKTEELLILIQFNVNRDTKAFIDLVFDALQNPVKKPDNFELKFNPQHSLEGKLYELNRIYNRDKDVLSAKCILHERDSKFEYKILSEQVPEYTLKAIKYYIGRRDNFKDYKDYISNKFKKLENANQISL